MPLSNYLASSRISQPGVCTSSTRPVSPYQGQVIYETDTAKTLVWNGSSWVFLSTSSAGDVGLVKIVPTGVTGGSLGTDGTITVGSGVSTIVVNNAFPSGFDNFRIVFSSMVPSTNNDLLFRLALSGTASVTGYYRGFSYVSLSTGAVTGVGNANVDNHIISSVTNNAFRHTGIVDVLQPNLAQYTGIVATSYIMRTDISSSGVTGSHQISTAYDGFTISTTSGTVTGGTIRVYGYRN